MIKACYLIRSLKECQRQRSTGIVESLRNGRGQIVHLFLLHRIGQHVHQETVKRRTEYQSVEQKAQEHEAHVHLARLINRRQPHGDGQTGQQAPVDVLVAPIDARQHIEDDCEQVDHADDDQPLGGREEFEETLPQELGLGDGHTPRLVVLVVGNGGRELFARVRIFVHAADHNVRGSG